MAKLIKSDEVTIGMSAEISKSEVKFSGGFNIGTLPTLYDDNLKYVEPVNLWFIDLIATKSLTDLSSYSRALLAYWNFLERNELKWNVIGEINSLKPTYRFRNQYLLPLARKGELAFSTANNYILHVVQFYTWASRNQLYEFNESNLPFQVKNLTINNTDSSKFHYSSFNVVTSDLSIKVPKSSTLTSVNSLNPLTINELQIFAKLIQHESIEFRLICLLALRSGLRMKECTGFTINALNGAIPTNDTKKRFNLKIGPINGVPTKNSKHRTIEITSNLLEQLNTYSLSERRLRRQNKFETETKFEPLFITQRGALYTNGSMQVLWSNFRKKYTQIYSSQFDHKFHNLRSSYGSYRLSSLLESRIEVSEAMGLLMGWMGHKDEKTTWKYLKYIRMQELMIDNMTILDSIFDKSFELANE